MTSEFTRIYNGTVAELERRQNRINELEAEVSRLKSLIYSTVPNFREPTPGDEQQEGETDKEHYARVFPEDGSAKWPVSMERIISFIQMRLEIDRIMADQEWQEYVKDHPEVAAKVAARSETR